MDSATIDIFVRAGGWATAALVLGLVLFFVLRAVVDGKLAAGELVRRTLDQNDLLTDAVRSQTTVIEKLGSVVTTLSEEVTSLRQQVAEMRGMLGAARR